MKAIRHYFLFLLSILAFNVNATALVSSENCNTSNAQLDVISSVFDVPASFYTDFDTSELAASNLLSTSYSATSCIGIFAGANDDGGLSSPNPNIGELGDGLLNGQDGLLTGLEFITEDDLQDIDQNGDATDPGWIHLVNYDSEKDEYLYSEAGPSVIADIVLDIGELLTLRFKCVDSDDDGCLSYEWVLATDISIIPDVQALLGMATFDHLAFSVKAGNGFAVYDFDFNEIFDLENSPDLNFATPYVLSGTISSYDFLNTNGNGNSSSTLAISHLNVWARDPADTTDIPEPSMALIIAGGLLVMVAVVRRRRQV